LPKAGIDWIFSPVLVGLQREQVWRTGSDHCPRTLSEPNREDGFSLPAPGLSRKLHFCGKCSINNPVSKAWSADDAAMPGGLMAASFWNLVAKHPRPGARNSQWFWSSKSGGDDSVS
jgi:hypothetical protein